MAGKKSMLHGSLLMRELLSMIFVLVLTAMPASVQARGHALDNTGQFATDYNEQVRFSDSRQTRKSQSPEENPCNLSPANDQWIKVYDSGGPNSFNDLISTGDDSYVTAGRIADLSTEYRPPDGWISRISTDGTIIWQKRYDTTVASFNAVSQIDDDGYIAVGSINLPSENSRGWIVRTNESGDIIWQKAYGGPRNEVFETVEPVASGGYVVRGWTWSFGSGNADVWILRLDAKGNIIWQKTYGVNAASSSGTPSSILKTPDSGYLIVTGHYESASASSEGVIMRLNANGGVVWQKLYGGPGVDSLSSIQETSDGNYIVSGVTTSYGLGNYDIWLLKIDDMGNVIWQKTYGGTDWDQANSVRQTPDGGYLLFGLIRAEGGTSDALIIKVDPNGSVEWQKTYGGVNFDSVRVGLIADNGDAIAAGITQSFNGAWIINSDESGEIGGLSECDIVRNSSVIELDSTVVPIEISTNVESTNVTPITTAAVAKNVSTNTATICESFDYTNKVYLPFTTN